MKEKELAKQLKQIKADIERKKIILMAREVVKNYGLHKSEVHSYHVYHEGKFSGKDYTRRELVIEQSGGWSIFGGEGLRINYDGSSVFYANTMSSLSFGNSPPESPIKIGNLYIHEYSPGKWEQQLDLIYRVGPRQGKKKIEKSVEKEVEQSKLEELARRLPIRL